MSICDPRDVSGPLERSSSYAKPTEGTFCLYLTDNHEERVGIVRGDGRAHEASAREVLDALYAYGAPMVSCGGMWPVYTEGENAYR